MIRYSYIFNKLPISSIYKFGTQNKKVRDLINLVYLEKQIILHKSWVFSHSISFYVYVNLEKKMVICVDQCVFTFSQRVCKKDKYHSKNVNLNKLVNENTFRGVIYCSKRKDAQFAIFSQHFCLPEIFIKHREGTKSTPTGKNAIKGEQILVCTTSL